MWTCGIYRPSLKTKGKLTRVWQSEPCADVKVEGSKVSGRGMAIRAAKRSGVMRQGDQLFVHRSTRE